MTEDPFLLTLLPTTHDLGGFKVHRTLPNRERTTVGPFIFFDQMGPAHLAPGTGIDVRPHPHINLATVTYLFAGAIDRREGAERIAMIDCAGEQIGDSGEVDMGVRPHVDAGAGRQRRRPHLVEEDERPDRGALTVRQGAVDLEAAEVVRDRGNRHCNHGVHPRVTTLSRAAEEGRSDFTKHSRSLTIVHLSFRRSALTARFPGA